MTPTGPWTKIATSSKLASSGSAQFIPRIGKGYRPGIQAWYNQFLAVDPANKDHVYLGLEEVYETQNGGSGWSTIGPYWNFGFTCFSYTPFEGTCDHNQTHSDQHAAIIAGGTLYVGNDGGVYSRALTNHAVGHWTNLNAAHGRAAVLRRSGQRRLHHLRRHAGQREQQGLHHAHDGA